MLCTYHPYLHITSPSYLVMWDYSNYKTIISPCNMRDNSNNLPLDSHPLRVLLRTLFVCMAQFATFGFRYHLLCNNDRTKSSIFSTWHTHMSRYTLCCDKKNSQCYVPTNWYLYTTSSNYSTMWDYSNFKTIIPPRNMRDNSNTCYASVSDFVYRLVSLITTSSTAPTMTHSTKRWTTIQPKKPIDRWFQCWRKLHKPWRLCDTVFKMSVKSIIFTCLIKLDLYSMGTWRWSMPRHN